jgi:hypothetical protein
MSTLQDPAHPATLGLSDPRAAAADADPEFASIATVHRETGFSRPKVQTLAVIGRIRTLVQLGQKPKYSLSDARAIARIEGQIN